MKREFKAHPLMIFSIIKPFLLILLIPVLRGIVKYIENGKVTTILGQEIAVLLVILIYGVLRWRLFRLTLDDDAVTVRDGLFMERKAVIPISGLSSVQSEQTPLDYILGSVTFRINTEAGSRQKTDYSFKLSRKDARTVEDLLYGHKSGEPVRFSPFKIALLAAATSSAFTGMLVGVPILNNTAKLAGVGVNEILEQLNTVSNKFQTYFPPIVNTVTLILLGSFLVSFIYSFFKYLRFRIFLNEDRVEVRSGLFVVQRTSFKKRSINNVIIEQSPLMILLKRYAMKVNVGGYGEAKAESQVLVPCGKYRELKNMFSDYFPFLTLSGNPLKSKVGFVHLNRYYFWGEIFAGILLLLSVYFGLGFREFSRLVVFITFILGCLIIYYMYLCYCEYKVCTARFGNTVYARGKRGLRKVRLYCPKEKIGEIKIYRYPVDPIYKTCNIKITIRSETADSMVVRHLDYEDTKKEIFDCYGIKE